MSNKESMVKRIKLMLGSSVLKIEISDEDIESLISIALDTIKPYLVDYKYITLPYARSIDLTEYNVVEVIRVIPSYLLHNSNYAVEADTYFSGISEYSISLGNGLGNSTAYLKEKALRTAKGSVYPDFDIPFDYDESTNTLMVSPYLISGDITIECLPDYKDVDELKDQKTLKWIYLYSLALTKEVIGRIRSKAQSQNVPIHLDGDTLLKESSAEKSKLEEELINNQSGPVGILR